MSHQSQLLLLDKHQVESLLTLEATLDAVREAFLIHSDGTGRLFGLVRESLAGGNIFGIKSGDVAPLGLLGFKAAGFWASNRAQGSEPHQATILLFDPETGRPRCVIDGNLVTTYRTGAAGGLGLQLLARRDSTNLCVFGTGVQARIQTRYALALVPELRHIRYVSAKGHADPLFEAEISATSATSGCVVSHAKDGDEAVAASDIVITATPARAPLFSADAIQPGTHLNCVGADTAGKRELPHGVLSRAKLFVDDDRQAREIGEAQWAKETPAIQLGDLLSGKATFQRQPADITVFDMTGIALQDLTVARRLLQGAETTGIGNRIDWPW